MYLLYVDALGMKARWTEGRLEDIRHGYALFEDYVCQALLDASPAHRVLGGVQSDGAALIFDDLVEAVEVGRALFRTCFFRATESERLWVRGLIRRADSELITYDKEMPHGLTSRQFTNAMLEAIIVETRFKGPRLVVDQAIVTEELRARMAVPVGSLHVVPLRTLRYTPGPDRPVGAQWQDVLYLVPDDITHTSVRETDEAVSRRMRWAATTPRELEQVAMLTAMWAESKAIIFDVGLRSRVLAPPEDTLPGSA